LRQESVKKCGLSVQDSPFSASWLLRPAAMDYMILKTIVTSIAAASIALAAPAYAYNGKTV
jgi:hypothetical protein